MNRFRALSCFFRLCERDHYLACAARALDCSVVNSVHTTRLCCDTRRFQGFLLFYFCPYVCSVLLIGRQLRNNLTWPLPQSSAVLPPDRLSLATVGESQVWRVRTKSSISSFCRRRRCRPVNEPPACGPAALAAS